MKFVKDEHETARLFDMSGLLRAVNDASEQMNGQTMGHEEANVDTFDIFTLIRDVDGLHHIAREDMWMSRIRLTLLRPSWRKLMII